MTICGFLTSQGVEERVTAGGDRQVDRAKRKKTEREEGGFEYENKKWGREREQNERRQMGVGV